MKIEHKIQPSFRNDTEYKVAVAFTVDDLMAARCGCNAGPSGHDKHICVHICPLLVLLMLLLFDGLAEHLLVELCSRWTSADDDKINQNESDDILVAVVAYADSCPN